MAKANVQRQKEWRERQNNLEEFQKKELDRLNAYNRKQNKTEFHAKHRDATHRWREGKRINNDNQTNHTPSEFSKSTKIMSHQSLGKATKRLKRVLPKSLSKRQYVVRTLAESMTIVQKEKVRVQAGLSQETVDKVKDFYQKEDVSLFMPGKQGVLTIRDKNGKRKEQKRILTMTINEAYEIFMSEQTEKIIGKSKFAELRPPEVLLSPQMPRNVCGCIYHTNVKILEEMYGKYPEHFTPYGEEFIKACICDPTSKSCMSSNCQLCKDKFQIKFVEELYTQGFQNNSAKWYQWEKSDDG